MDIAAATRGAFAVKRSTPLAAIAASLGLSTSTVSRALRRPELVKPETRTAIMIAAKKAGYSVDLERQPPKARIGSIGLVVPDIENPFFSVLLKSVLHELRRHGVSLVLADTNEEPLGESEIISTMLPRVDGLILASSRLDEAEIVELVRNKPLVLVNREVEGIPSVVIDPSSGTRQAVEHLAALGHKRIVYVEGPVASLSNRQRRDSFREAMQALGLDAAGIGPYAPRFEGGVQAADIAVARGCTAIIAYNDLMAFGIMSRLASRGVKVPDDMSVIGFDDVPAASIWSPPLTSVTGSTTETGKMATQSLIRLIGGKAREPHVSRRVLSQLVVRASTGACPLG
ncbi:LacI family DNA-binding transcriptional regulator [Labrys monachus]|uniref:LacI family transcriptional regulator n=1 Tax=Labrys monachus TaxID=217067 RepID=A0ABU0FL78_9HYPH|nr:substrate-binding domain-containing protein [Labrys monachus]MDQ0394800.1 LacI family transcriptional regulator [Labrys monachus]